MSDSRPSSYPAMKVCPLVSRSSPARQWRRVDFPDPDAPMMAVNWCETKSALIPSRARTAVSPRPYTLTASTVRAAMGTSSGGGGAGGGGGPGAVWLALMACQGTLP